MKTKKKIQSVSRFIILSGVFILIASMYFRLSILNEELVLHHEYDPKKELDHLREKIEKEPEYMVECHAEAHEIGHNAYKALGDKSYDYASPMCGGGYLHGVLEQAFSQNGIQYLSTVVHSGCSDESMESCLHGIGHGLHTLLGDIPKSLSACSEINTSNTDCFDGVFMDVFDSEGVAAKENISLSSAQNICKSAAKKEQSSCYFYLPRVVFPVDHTAIVALCSSFEVGEGWAACAEGSGVYFMKRVSGFNKKIAIEYCSEYVDKNMKKLCIDGVNKYEQYGGAENTRWH